MDKTELIRFKRIASGEIVGAKAIEIVSVPDYSILVPQYSNEMDAIKDFKNGMMGMLAEVYQSCKNFSLSSQNSFPDVAIELLWCTEPVQNQPYQAAIRMFLILRGIGQDEATVASLLDKVANLCTVTLRLQKYTYSDVDVEAFLPLLREVDTSSIIALVKDEKLINLQNMLMPSCLGFDRIPESAAGLSKLVNSLMGFPNVAVSIQLIPTVLAPETRASLEQNFQMLDTLSYGIMEQGIGNVSFASASNPLETYRFYHDNQDQALFDFNFVVYGSRLQGDSVASALYGQLNSGCNSKAQIKFIRLQTEEANLCGNFYPLPWAIHEVLLQAERNPELWSIPNRYYIALYNLPYLLTAEEASEIFRLPIGGSTIRAGLQINESIKNSQTYSDNLINAGDITVGVLKSSGENYTIGIQLDDIAKHMLVVGTPGSGKTTFSVGLLDQLWKKHKIPFLVIEPAKNEYRALIQSIPELQIFTPGKNYISPFVFNPFVPPKNVRLETYKSTLKTAFAAAVSMATPLDKIFEDAIHNCYSDFRWLDSYTVSDKGKIFNIADFIKCFRETFDSIGYTGDARNIGRAGVVRLNSLARLFDNYYSIPIEDLLTKPTVIELSAIENSDQKSLIISLVLLSILAYVNSNYIGKGGLRNVILLEEAHVLLDADTNFAGVGEANPSAIAQGLIKRMLAELRSYGVGMIIADQSPRKVSTDVVALTDMKVAFRIVEAMDRQILSDSMGLNETQSARMARLKPGEAYLFFNRLDAAEEILTPNYRLENNIDISLSDSSIASLSTYWRNKPEFLRPYPYCEIVPCCRTCCDYNRRLLAKEIARRIFVRNLKSDTADFSSLKEVFAHISALIVAELNDEPYSRELLSCVKVHLWRKIRYETKIRVSDAQIEASLKK